MRKIYTEPELSIVRFDNTTNIAVNKSEVAAGAANAGVYGAGTSWSQLGS